MTGLTGRARSGICAFLGRANASHVSQARLPVESVGRERKQPSPDVAAAAAKLVTVAADAFVGGGARQHAPGMAGPAPADAPLPRQLPGCV